MKYHVGDILFSKLNDKYAFTVVKTKGDRMCIVASHYRFGEKISKCYEARKKYVARYVRRTSLSGKKK